MYTIQHVLNIIYFFTDNMLKRPAYMTKILLKVTLNTITHSNYVIRQNGSCLYDNYKPRLDALIH